MEVGVHFVLIIKKYITCSFRNIGTIQKNLPSMDTNIFLFSFQTRTHTYTWETGVSEEKLTHCLDTEL